MNQHKLYIDMLKQGHLLIGGTTGSGKSVAENGLIYTLINRPPQAAKLILIDPKKVELYPYRNTKNCIRYADNNPDIIKALQDAISIMDNRYLKMRKRNLKTYDGGDLWVVIDEYADLITTAKNK